MVNGSQCHLDTNLAAETADRAPKSTRYDLENMIYISSEIFDEIVPAYNVSNNVWRDFKCSEKSSEYQRVS